MNRRTPTPCDTIFQITARPFTPFPHGPFMRLVQNTTALLKALGGLLSKRRARTAFLAIKAALSESEAETLDMLDTYQKFLRGKASRDDIRRANREFADLLRTAGLGAIALAPVPGAVLGLWIAVRVGRRYGVEILPPSLRRFETAYADAKAADN